MGFKSANLCTGCSCEHIGHMQPAQLLETNDMSFDVIGHLLQKGVVSTQDIPFFPGHPPYQ